MDNALRVRFRQFAMRWSEDDQVDDNGLTGADLQYLAKALDDALVLDLSCATADYASETRRQERYRQRLHVAMM